MQKIPVIPQLERSRQRAAALAKQASSSMTDPKTSRYLSPAQQTRPSMPEPRKNDKSTPPNKPNKPRKEIQGVLSWTDDTRQGSPSVRSNSSDSLSSELSSSVSSGRGSQRRRTPPFPDGSKKKGVNEQVEVWHGRRKGGNRAPKIEPEGTKTWRSPNNSQERKVCEEIPPPPTSPLPEEEVGLTSLDLDGEELDMRELGNRCEMYEFNRCNPSQWYAPPTTVQERNFGPIGSKIEKKISRQPRNNDLLPGHRLSLQELLQPWLIETQ